jgi:hypothetical protein|tara:strand:- start:1967 stop:2230 length:264 start_codon:yes stop_codon:yes gene_type:complete
MTKIYIYCLFDRLDAFLGVYSSLQAVHRDALRACNRGNASVYMKDGESYVPPTLKLLRNTFKGQCDVEIEYRSDSSMIKILKTKLRE